MPTIVIWDVVFIPNKIIEEIPRMYSQEQEEGDPRCGTCQSWCDACPLVAMELTPYTLGANRVLKWCTGGVQCSR